MYAVVEGRTGIIFGLFSQEFTHLGMLWRAISQVRAKLCGSAEDSGKKYIVQKLKIYRIEKMDK